MFCFEELFNAVIRLNTSKVLTYTAQITDKIKHAKVAIVIHVCVKVGRTVFKKMERHRFQKNGKFTI
jgi:hypothetical protein